MKRFSKSLIAFLAVIIASASLYALSVGQSVSNVTIRDANDNPATIPDLGAKVLTIFYNDAEAADISDPMSDALKAKNYPETKTRGIGIANLKDSVAPNWVIRKIVQSKIKKYNSTILTDVNLTLANSWGLGYCNNKSICIIIGKDSKVKYIKYMDKNNPPSQADIDYVVKLVGDLIK
ncbi:MAG TPA: YtfJ family protein [Spirochaetota bacterium]|jgi:predicted transcriptional regulator|nr:YtfJ family protein [Spirochaetota bacterium]HOV09041.1 YtfJ family protein [Spirochaetota bacterium]